MRRDLDLGDWALLIMLTWATLGLLAGWVYTLFLNPWAWAGLPVAVGFVALMVDEWRR